MWYNKSMKKISIKQIEVLLQVIYQTNISAQTFDGIKKMLLSELETIKDENKNPESDTK